MRYMVILALLCQGCMSVARTQNAVEHVFTPVTRVKKVDRDVVYWCYWQGGVQTCEKPQR